jgi:hypothetical protein
VRVGGSIQRATLLPGDEFLSFDEATLRAVDFAPRPLRSAGRGPLVVGVWMAGFAFLVGVAWLAGGETGQPLVAERADATLQAPAARSPEHHWPPDRRAAAAWPVVDLQAPAPARVEVTSPGLEVAGAMLVHAARVEIDLEAIGNRVVGHATVDVTDLDGGIRPAWTPAFSTILDLPDPRPNGPMWVVVRAYDADGESLGGTRRAFLVGPLLEPDPASLVPRLDLEGPPTCSPESPTMATSC